ncbi:MAG: GFA family protein [Gammaproteobacteria bacterium]|nr:GFA family protein [Gammaproteobacteria bacterium]
MIILTEVDGVKVKKHHLARCHCGAVEIELTLPDGLVDIRRCDCSLCRRRGAVAASVPLSGIKIVKGEASIKQYTFNTCTAKHYFCRECGIYTHHQRRSNPTQYGFNVACLEGINPLKIDDIPTYDGVNHPADAVVDNE